MSNGRRRSHDHQLVPMSGDPIPSSGAGRVCDQEGCATVLSIYNRTEFCSLHARPGIWRVNHVL
jgi:hypothetical protein